MNFTDFKKTISHTADKIVFVGLGNQARGDDAAGLMFLTELQKRSEYRKSVFINAGANPENYLEAILQSHPKLVVFIDAVDGIDSTAEMGWIEPADLDNARISTHAFNIALIEQYLKSCQRLEVKYFGLRSTDRKIGSPVSTHLLRALEQFFS
ncbi:MAG: hydrogenase maturation protease [Calditrichaeota bacterium]|nr:MAG: hydrogenase maturation protease [Calditrichota bacterium]